MKKLLCGLLCLLMLLLRVGGGVFVQREGR